MERVRLFFLITIAGALALGAFGAATAGAAPVGMAQSIPTRCGVKALAPTPAGDVWFGCFNEEPISGGGRASIGRVTAAGKVREFKGPIAANNEPWDIIRGPDGNIWVALNPSLQVGPGRRHPAQIARVTPSGKITTYQAGLPPRAEVRQLLAGPDGDVWFSTTSEGPSGDSAAIGKIAPSGQISIVPVGLGPGQLVSRFALGPDGNFWLAKTTSATSAVIARLTPAGALTEYGAAIPGFDPGNPVLGPDGNIWFLEPDKSHTVARITTGGEIAEFGPGIAAGVLADSLTSGDDGDLWFTTQAQAPAATGIARVGAGSGQIDAFNHCLRYGQPFFGPQTLVAGPDGDLWFTSLASRSLPSISDPPSIGRITPSGEISQIYGGVKREPIYLTATSRWIWFSAGYREIQRIAPPSAPVNTFHLLPAEEAAKNGAADARVIVNGPGKLRIEPLALVLGGGRTVPIHGRAASARASGCGTAKVAVRPVGAALARFRQRHFARERVAVTFTPAGGTPYTHQAEIEFLSR